MIIHTRYKESLYGYIPKECLPEEYGGELGPMMELHGTTKITQSEFFKYNFRQECGECCRTTRFF